MPFHPEPRQGAVGTTTGCVVYDIPGLKFPEGPRWHAGRFWISDQLGGRVLTLSEDGGFTEVAAFSRPSGIGFTTSGDALVARMDEPLVVRIGAGGLVEPVVDLSPLGVRLNDMVIDPRGRMYLGAYPIEGDEVARSSIVFVDAGGTPTIAATGLSFPNGIAVTPDLQTLLVAETKAAQITAFSIAADGSLSEPTVWAAMAGRGPDGLCLDAEGCVWVGCPWTGEALRVAKGGAILESITVPGRWVMACALGGVDGRTLLLCMAVVGPGGHAAGESVGYVETRRVTVPGVGCP